MPTPDFQFDAWLDRQLVEVPLPDDLLGKLHAVAVPDDAEIDAELRDIPVPSDLLRRLTGTAPARRRWRSVAEMMVAASLLIGIGLSYFGAAMGFLWTLDPAAELPRLLARETVQVDLDLSFPGLAAPLLLAVEPPEAVEPAEAPSERGAVVGPPILLAEYGSGFSRRSVDFEGPYGVFGPLGGAPKVDPLMDLTLFHWGVFGAHDSFDDLPELRKVRGWIPRGVDAPLVPGFDISFLIRFGVHPFVSPAVRPELRRSKVPLDIDTSSYDLTRRYLADGELPPPEAIRTEEFLAAVDYQFPRPASGAVGLYAGGSPWPAAPGLHLLQVAVQAKDLPTSEHEPVHLILVIDTSSSMQWGGRLEAIARAVERLRATVGPADRLSIVAFGEQPRLVAEGLQRSDVDALAGAMASLTPGGSTNVGAGLRLGYAVADGSDVSGELAGQVVLLTDGLAELDLGSVMRIEDRLREARDRSIRLHIVDLGQKRERQQIDPVLEQLAAAGGGIARRATGHRGVFWAMREVVDGRTQLVASEVRLEIEFDPRTVAAYRLLGHEAKAVAGLMPAELSAEFRAGQSGQALYVLRLKPGASGRVAVAETTWRDPDSGQLHRRRRAIEAGDFGATLLAAPLPVQAAAVVAQTAEILRQSPFVRFSPNLGSLDQVRRFSRELDTRLYANGSFGVFLSVLEEAAKSRPYRGGERP